MIKQIQLGLEYLSRTGNERNMVLFIICFILFFILIGAGLMYLYTLAVEWRLEGKRKPEAFDDLGFTWKGDTFSKIKRVK